MSWNGKTKILISDYKTQTLADLSNDFFADLLGFSLFFFLCRPPEDSPQPSTIYLRDYETAAGGEMPD
jgi:hypothetical protein